VAPSVVALDLAPVSDSVRIACIDSMKPAPVLEIPAREVVMAVRGLGGPFRMMGSGSGNIPCR